MELTAKLIQLLPLQTGSGKNGQWKKQDIIVNNTIRFYLFTAIRNNCLTYLNKGKKTVIIALNDYDAAGEQIPFYKEENHETDYPSLLTNAINQLPPKCREVFL